MMKEFEEKLSPPPPPSASGSQGIGMDLSLKPYRISLGVNSNLVKFLFITAVLLNLLILATSSNVTYTGFNYSISRPKSPPLEVYRSAKSEYL